MAHTADSSACDTSLRPVLCVTLSLQAVVYNIRPGGYVHLERTVYEDEEDEEDRGVSPWKLVTRSGMTGVYFTG